MSLTFTHVYSRRWRQRSRKQAQVFFLHLPNFEFNMGFPGQNPLSLWQLGSEDSSLCEQGVNKSHEINAYWDAKW